MSTRDGGSEHNPSTFFRVDFEFDSSWDIGNLVTVLYDDKHIPQWDPMIQECEFSTMSLNGSENPAEIALGTPENKTIGRSWTKHKRIMHLSSRDYCDKQINFYHDGKFYHYQTSIPD